MAQAQIGTINPTAQGGVSLAGILTAFSAAYASNNLGAARPSYITAGGLWTQLTGASAYKLFMNTPGGDILIGSWSSSTGFVLGGTAPVTVTPGTVVGGMSVAYAGGSASQPFNGNTVTLTLVNDVTSPGNNFTYGTNGSGVKGWQAPVAAVVPAPQQLNSLCYTQGTYTFTVPANVNALSVVLIGPGGSVSVGGRIMFTVSVTPGVALSLQVGAHSASSPTVINGTGVSNCFANAGDFSGALIGTTQGPTGVPSSNAVPGIDLPDGTRAGSVGVNGAAMISWISKNI